VQLTTGVGGGKNIGVPPGRKCHVFSDGTDMDFVNAQDPGTAYDLHGALAMPSWMTACSVLPYLIKDGNVYSNTTYPGLASYLQNLFGGTPGLTFAVPDELARARIGYDTVGTGRLTAVISGINGRLMGAAGGNQSMQSHTHGASSADSGHEHSFPNGDVYGDANSGGGFFGFGGSGIPLYKAAQTNVGNANVITTISATGNGLSQNVQPSIVSFLPLIKT